MSDANHAELKRAADFIRAGREPEARAILVDYIRKNPASDHAWSLMSFVVHEPDKQIDCLNRALKLNPNNLQAQARLSQIKRQNSIFDPRASAGVKDTGPFVTGSELPEEPAGPAPSADPIQALRDSGAASPFFAQPAADPAAQPRKPAKPRRKPVRIPGACLWIVLGVIALSVLGSAIGVIAFLQGRENVAFLATREAYGLVPSETPYRTLPPTWTITPTPTTMPTRTPRPTYTPTATATFMVPAGTAEAQMDKIEQQVSDLRGLTGSTVVPRYILPKQQAEAVLRGQLTEADLAGLERQQKVLSAFGLIKPTYDLVNLALNHLADSIGGFYLPGTDEIFVLGLQFGGLEHYIYAHEYNHALQDQNFGLEELGISPDCTLDQQACQAVDALVEGDSTLLMTQWWEQYASPQDYQDILRYIPGAQALPEEFAPPFAEKDLNFAYEQGMAFVQYLYERGRWARVNQAYKNPPTTTEHILHPDLYVSGEVAAPVTLPDLAAALGPGWELQDENVLGEWSTYLMLGYGADLAGQIEDQAAADAASGWGGDRYAVLYNPAENASVLAAHWEWDTSTDGEEFAEAMEQHLHERFRGGTLERAGGGSCWQSAGQVTCLWERPSGTLWIIAPDEETLDLMKSQIEGF